MWLVHIRISSPGSWGVKADVLQRVGRQQSWVRYGEYSRHRRGLRLNIGWIVDADITGLFGNIDHSHLREIIKQRVNDGGILWSIGWRELSPASDWRLNTGRWRGRSASRHLGCGLPYAFCSALCAVHQAE